MNEPGSGRAGEPLLAPGRNCWRVARAGRLRFLVDGEAYFSALASALRAAQRRVWILGWDVHSRTRLRPDDPNSELGRFLDACAEEQPELHVHVLAWDFAMIYALERESLPVYRLGWKTHRRVHFRLDDQHPIGASHHQKLVVVDDRVAFAGGLDLTIRRWDTREHVPEESRRTDPDGDPYGPFHDLQVMVDGDAAAALGELARERWLCATGERVGPAEAERDPWPEDLAPDVENVEVGVARTQPAWKGAAEAREVEALTLDAIAAARRSVYVENQYFTAPRVAEALGARLEEAQGPDVVLVGPKRCTGWLEEAVMGVRRDRLLRGLRERDRHGRLRCVYPVVAGDTPVMVHAKVLVVDDRIARVGSANLSNRSMGLDTECDLVLDARGEERIERAVARFRDGLLAEHLGVDVERVLETRHDEGSLARTLDRLQGGERTLRTLEPGPEGWLEELAPEKSLFDPERPVAGDLLAEERLDDREGGARRPLWRAAGTAIVVIGLAAAWRWTPLGAWLEPERLAAAASVLREAPLGPPMSVALFVVASLAMVPVTALIVAMGLLHGSWLGFVCAVSGALASAALGYAVGRILWRDAVRRLGGSRLNRLSRALGRRGILAVATVRLVPVAPFTVVNLVAGSSHVRFRDFALGTLLVMTPGTLLMTALADRAVDVVRAPQPRSVLLALVLLAGIGVAVRAARAWLARRPPAAAEPAEE